MESAEFLTLNAASRLYCELENCSKRQVEILLHKKPSSKTPERIVNKLKLRRKKERRKVTVVKIFDWNIIGIGWINLAIWCSYSVVVQKPHFCSKTMKWMKKTRGMQGWGRYKNIKGQPDTLFCNI